LAHRHVQQPPLRFQPHSTTPLKNTIRAYPQKWPALILSRLLLIRSTFGAQPDFELWARNPGRLGKTSHPSRICLGPGYSTGYQPASSTSQSAEPTAQPAQYTSESAKSTNQPTTSSNDTRLHTPLSRPAGCVSGYC